MKKKEGEEKMGGAETESIINIKRKGCLGEGGGGGEDGRGRDREYY